MIMKLRVATRLGEYIKQKCAVLKDPTPEPVL